VNDEEYNRGGYIPPVKSDAKQTRCDRPDCPVCTPAWPDLDLTEFPPAIVLFAAFAGGAVFGVLVMVVVAAGNGWLG
jgi:hypothetical protein